MTGLDLTVGDEVQIDWPGQRISAHPHAMPLHGKTGVAVALLDQVVVRLNAGPTVRVPLERLRRGGPVEATGLKPGAITVAQAVEAARMEAAMRFEGRGLLPEGLTLGQVREAIAGLLRADEVTPRDRATDRAAAEDVLRKLESDRCPHCGEERVVAGGEARCGQGFELGIGPVVTCGCTVD